MEVVAIVTVCTRVGIRTSSPTGCHYTPIFMYHLPGSNSTRGSNCTTPTYCYSKKKTCTTNTANTYITYLLTLLSVCLMLLCVIWFRITKQIIRSVRLYVVSKTRLFDGNVFYQTKVMFYHKSREFNLKFCLQVKKKNKKRK